MVKYRNRRCQENTYRQEVAYIVLREVRRAKYEQSEKVCSEVNCLLGFKQSVAAWKVLTGMRKNLNTKTNIPLIPSNQGWNITEIY